MSNTVIKVENLSKQYRLGDVGTGSMKDDLIRFRHRLMGKEDPFLTIGEENDRSTTSKSDYVWALRNINFEVQHGDIVGIIGRNGAGKSTLLKILSRTTGPTTGSVKMKGRIASLLEVGTGFHGELSGRENIYLNGAIMGLRKHEITNKLDEIIDFAGVERYINTPVKRYSSGMYVRLAFAVAAHLEPDILIVDEVLAVGDAEFQKKALGKMQDVSGKQGRTVLFVSHDMEAISKLTRDAVYLVNGKIAATGKTSDVIRHYINTTKSKDLIYLSTKDDLKPHIKKVELKTSLPNNYQVNGDQLQIKIDLFTPFPIKGACFAFHIIDSKERNFIHQWVFDSDMPYCYEKGVYELVCVMPDIKLYMGKYFLKCFFSEPPGGRVFEILENICPFEVVMYETTRSEFSWYPEACAYLEKSNWFVNKI